MFLLFLAFVVLLAGFVAYAADTIARRVGRRHLRLFGLRPKTSALIVAVASGMGISLASVLAFGLLNRQALRNIAQADSVRLELRDLKARVEPLRQTVRDTQRDLARAQVQRDSALEQARIQETERTLAIEGRDDAKAQAQLYLGQRAQAITQRERVAAEAQKLQARVGELAARRDELEVKAREGEQALEGARVKLQNLSAQFASLQAQGAALKKVRASLQAQVRATQEQARREQRRADEAQARADQAQASAENAGRQASAAQKQVQAARQQASAAQQATRREQARATQAQAQARAAEARTLKAQTAAAAARAQAAAAARQTAGLQAQVGKLGQQLSVLQLQVQQAQAQGRGLRAERDLFQAARDAALRERDAARGDVRAQQEVRSRLLSTNDDLRRDLQSAQAQQQHLEDDVSAARARAVVYKKGDLVHAQVVAGVLSLPEALSNAASKADTMGASGSPAAVLPDDQQERLRAKLRGLNSSAFVIFRAGANVVQGYPVELSADVFPDKLLYRRGQTIRAAQLQLGGSFEQRQAQLLDLVKDAVVDLGRGGVPYENIRDGGLSSAETLQFLSNLRAQVGAQGSVLVALKSRGDVRPDAEVDLYPDVIR